MKASPFARFEASLAADPEFGGKAKKPAPCIIGVPVSPDLKEQLRGLAAGDRRTLANYCRKVMEEHVRAALLRN